MFILTVPCQAQEVIRVNKGSEGAGDGSSWENAYSDLNDALQEAGRNTEIWVAKGIYYPDKNTNERDSAFHIGSGIEVYGGFSGLESERSERNRDPRTNGTVLSGNIGISDDSTDNSYHVVAFLDADSTTILDGFTVRDGVANSPDQDYYGGGIYVKGGSPQISHLVIAKSYATYRGGGLYVQNSQLTLRSVSITQNSSGFGGGMYVDGGHVILLDVSLEANDAVLESGGGLYVKGATADLANVTIAGNEATYLGGGIYFRGTQLKLANAVIRGNAASKGSGAMYAEGRSVVTNSTVVGNRGGIKVESSHTVAFRNSILWGNHPWKSEMDISCQIEASYSIVQGRCEGTEVVASNPLFNQPVFYEEAPTLRGDLQLTSQSPALNQGSERLVPPDSLDMDGDGDHGEPIPYDRRGRERLQEGAVDLGALEGGLPTSDRVFYVDDEASGGGEGSSWADAFADLQSALDVASYTDEIWVAEGTYLPTQGADRDAGFRLRCGVKLYGGFQGTETRRSERQPEAFPTILDGNIGVRSDTTDNSHHVIQGRHLDSSAVLDGFTVRHGYAETVGGGIRFFDSDPVLRNLTITRNRAIRGGGMHIRKSNPLLKDVRFIGNVAISRGGGVSYQESSPVIANALFQRNYATDGYGGGMNVGSDSFPFLINVEFIENGAAANESGGGLISGGGGMAIFSASHPTLVNAVFRDNRAKYGGGIYTSGEPTLVNLTITRNHANVDGGALLVSGGKAQLLNSIVWGNEATTGWNDQIYDNSGQAFDVRSSIIEGGYAPGTGVLNQDPLFASADDVRLLETSPAIDMGKNDFLPADSADVDLDGDRAERIPLDLSGSKRVQNNIVDLGAFEGGVRGSSRVLRVKEGAVGAEDGSSWSDAFPHLQDALRTARPADEIWVANGIYYPDRGQGIASSYRDTSFVLKSGVSLYGGFVGNEMRRQERNVDKTKTVLSGDIGAPREKSDNSYHVVTGAGTHASTVLDGFIIRNGNGKEGGGMYNTDGAGPAVRHVRFVNNSAEKGGGMYNANSQPELTEVVFEGNKAKKGGGIYNYYSSYPLVNVTFEGNEASSQGGGIYNERSGPLLVNTVFYRNRAKRGGGGILNDNQYHKRPIPKIINSTFHRNVSTGYQGGAVHNRIESEVKVRNSIFWRNESYYDIYITPNIDYSLTEDENIEGDPNLIIAKNPLFVGSAKDRLRLAEGSPAIDIAWTAALPNDTVDLDRDGDTQETIPLDRAGKPRMQGGGLDLGAFEGGAPLSNDVIYVRDDASPGSKGDSWKNAFANLQQALRTAGRSDEIWVAKGTYRPTHDTSRSATFSLKEGVALYGGFAGTEGERVERNPAQHQTILSGDIGRIGKTSDNVYHVVTAGSVDSTALLDGFLVTEGHAEKYEKLQGHGGGLLVKHGGRPMISNVVFTRNYARYGGGVFNQGNIYDEGSGPVFMNVVFYKNRAATAAAMAGKYSWPRLYNATISSNTSESADLLLATLDVKSINHIYNSIIWGNGEGIYERSNEIRSSFVEWSYEAGEDVLYMAPQFHADSSWNLRLSKTSPALDAGKNDYLPPDWLDVDNDGNEKEPYPIDLMGERRMLDNGSGEARVDLGAFEGAKSVSSALSPAFLSKPYELSEVAPTPFSHSARLQLAVRQRQKVRIVLFDLLGRKVKYIHKGELAPERYHKITIEGSSLSSGVYVILVTGEHFRASRRAVIMK